MISVVELGDFAFFIHQKRHVIEAVLGDKVAVGFGGIAVYAQNFDVTLFVFFDVLLKLNKLFNSEACVVFGIKRQHDAAVICQNFAECP